MLAITLAGAEIRLLASGAAYLPQHGTLLIADAHVGKAASFRKLGVPVPRGTTGQTLQRLDQALAATGANCVVFLGDFLHSAHAHAAGTLTAVARWRDAHPDLSLVLVRGNHDLHAGDPPAALGITLADEPLTLGPYALCHHPQPVDGAYVLAGHWHPCVTLGGRGRERLRRPCFWFGDEQAHPVGVLPAFGSFTGMHPIAPRLGDRVFVTGADAVHAVPAGALS